MTKLISFLEFMLQKHIKIVHCNNFTHNERFFCILEAACIYTTLKVMFTGGKHKYKGGELMFKGGEHKFTVQEQNLRNNIKRDSSRAALFSYLLLTIN